MRLDEMVQFEEQVIKANTENLEKAINHYEESMDNVKYMVEVDGAKERYERDYNRYSIMHGIATDELNQR